MSDYDKKLIQKFGGAGIMFMLAAAKDVGIVQALLDTTTPMTSQQIADKMGLRERYVREVLATLAVGEVISVDATSTLYHVPDVNKETFRNVSSFAKYIPVAGKRYSAVINCYHKDGPAGIRYSDFPGMFEVLEDVMKIVKKDILDTDILPSIPGFENKLESGIHVGEFGCATGVLISRIAARFPKSKCTGMDVAELPLVEARKAAASEKLQNVEFEAQDLYALPDSLKEKFDWIVVRDVIHDLPKPQKGLCEINKCLKPGAIFSMIDIGMSGEVVKEIGDPFSMFYYMASGMFCVCESFQRNDSEALGATWGAPLARQMLAKAGFKILNETVSKTDPKEIHFVCQK